MISNVCLKGFEAACRLIGNKGLVVSSNSRAIKLSPHKTYFILHTQLTMLTCDLFGVCVQNQNTGNRTKLPSYVIRKRVKKSLAVCNIILIIDQSRGL